LGDNRPQPPIQVEGASGKGEEVTDVDPDLIETVRRMHVTPDAGVLRAIGLNHDFDSAVADLVDNSIDANAASIVIRFVVRDGRATQLLVIDDGSGMDEIRIDNAMRLGKPKSDSANSLGHFGMGLKSASFSQAAMFTVLSKRAGCDYEGRRMRRDNPARDFEVEVLDSDAVGRRLQILRDIPNSGASGTVVQWDDCRTFPASLDTSVTTAFIEHKVSELRNHLGLIFHRLLSASEVSLSVEVWDFESQQAGLRFPVNPIDPFGYNKASSPAGYPKRLDAFYNHRNIQLDCHIWPGGSDSPQFRLYGQPVEHFQGFYLYRNRRLLMTGGWGGVTQENKTLKLARIAVDIENHLDGFTMSVEKAGVHLTADVVHAIELAKAHDGTTFHEYLVDAAQTFKASNRRMRRRTPILPPGQGIHPRIKRAVERTTPLLEGEEPIRIRWKRLADEDFVEIDRPARTLWINSRYRPAVLHGLPGGVNDAPLLKTLLYLVYEDLFRGQAVGAKDKENQMYWNHVLTAAALVEEAGDHG
jgi:hypothetical protein